MNKGTHIAVGIAAATGLACIIPQMRFSDIETYSIGIGIAAIGSILPDIDLNGTSKLKRTLRSVFLLAIVAIVLLAAQAIKTGAFYGVLTSILCSKSAIGMLVFLGICFIGYKSNHRTFTHQLIGAVCFTVPLSYAIGTKLAIWFCIGFVSHQLIDMLNKRKIKWLYPFNIDFAQYVCDADGIASKLIGCIAGVFSVIFIAAAGSI